MDVPAWPISIGPLTPAHVFAQGELQPLRPDRTVAELPTAGVERQLHRALAMLAAVLVAWAGWWAWRNWREARQLPFARAWSQVRLHGEDKAEAWLALHHALNQTAGHVVQAATLPRLLGHAPHLMPLRAELEGFYRESSARFFAVDVASNDATAPQFPLRDISRALRDIERRHQR
jgi:mxaA protein